MVLQTLDLTFDPCHDFYHYACGNRSNSNIANNLVEILKNTIVINQRLRELIEEASQPNDIRAIVVAKQYYVECMRTDFIELRGLEPLKKLLAQIGGWPVVEGANWNSSLNWTEQSRVFVQEGLRTGLLVEMDVMENILNPANSNRILRVSFF